MRPTKHRSIFVPVALTIGITTLLGIGGVGVLHAMGIIELPFLSRKAFEPPPGTVAVIISAQTVPPYTKVTRDHLFQKSGTPKVVYLTPGEIKRRGIYTEFDKIIGRVTSKEIHSGFAFREKDFLPEGSREGVAGATPPGKRSMTLDAVKIIGIENLKMGDRFDLIASYVNEVPKNDPHGRPHSLRFHHLPGQKKYAVAQVIVQDGFVVQPSTTRSIPKPHSAVPPNGKLNMLAHQELVIAVEPEEVAAISQALIAASEMRVVQRSGRVEPEKNSSVSYVAAERVPDRTPSTPLPPPDIVIEVIQGKKHEWLAFPSPEAESASAAPLGR